jgi:hypothetical protein
LVSDVAAPWNETSMEKKEKPPPAEKRVAELHSFAQKFL